MKLPVFLFLVLLGMCVVIGVVLMTPEIENGHGYAHPTFGQSMQQGASGLERHARVRWLGLALGLLQISFFVGCLVAGVRRRTGKVVWAYFFTGLVYLAIFCAMVIADSFYVREANPTLIFGFPLPTALMIYGLGGIPLMFVLFYIVNFDRWILRPEDLQRFQESLQQNRQRSQDEG